MFKWLYPYISHRFATSPFEFTHLFIEPTNRCNLKCPACNRDPLGNSDMSLEIFEQILDVLKHKEDQDNYMNLYWRGEPTLHSRLPEMVEMSKKRGYRPYTSTNTVTPNLHDEDYVTRLLSSLYRFEVCVDGYNQETLNKYRIGSKWSKLIKNLGVISGVDTDCIKEMRVLMFKWNEEKEEFFRDLARKYNMTVLRFGVPVIGGRQALSLMEVANWLPDNPKYRRYEPKWMRWVHKSSRSCSLLPVISVTGEVASCCYDWNLDNSVGNILEDDLDTIKHRMDEIKFKMLRRKLEICKTLCRLPMSGMPVNYVEEIV